MKRIVDILITTMFAMTIVGFAIAFLVLPDSDFSEEENRSLTTFPEVTMEKIGDGRFSEEINIYFADQFPVRDCFVTVKGFVELLFGKGENNGVLLGENEQLAVRLYTVYKSRLERVADMDYYFEKNIDASIESLNKWAEKEARPIATILPPRTIDVAASAFDYPTEISDMLNEQIASSVIEEVNYINLLPIMRDKYDAGEYVYYRTDHHWTTYGAYIAYCELMKSWGLENDIIPKEAFQVEKVPDFYGTTWSKAGLKFVDSDTLELWSLGNDAQFTTNCYASKRVKGEDGKPVIEKEAYSTFSSWLNRQYLEQKDKYATLLDGTHNEQTVFSNTETGRERLLIVKDSFANALVPFLAQHYDLVVVNLANKLTNASSYAEEYDCDRILIVYNWGNLIENNYLAAIK